MQGCLELHRLLINPLSPRSHVWERSLSSRFPFCGPAKVAGKEPPLGLKIVVSFPFSLALELKFYKFTNYMSYLINWFKRERIQQK